MATKNDTTDLAARCEALGCELIVSDKGEQFVIRVDDAHSDVFFIHRDDGDDDLAGWLARRERGEPMPGVPPNAAVLTPSRHKRATPNIKEAAEKIRDVIRYTQLCAAALDTDGHDALNEVEETIGGDVWVALQDALVALGVQTKDEIGVYQNVEQSSTAEVAHG